MNYKLNNEYDPLEEKLNIISHAIGILFSLVIFPFLLLKSFLYTGFFKPFSLLIYAVSLFVLYVASTSYHAAKNPIRRRKLNIFDHAAIYVLIAGSYSPYCIIVLDSVLGWYMFLFVWLFALVGIVLKLFFTGKFSKISTTMYLLMGWQIVFFIKPLTENLNPLSLNLLFFGGAFYSIGAVIYSIKKIPFNHAIFHLFVLLGSICHFFSIYNI